jgi:beta-glucosidase-like glycosyl hydrolase
MSCSWNVALLEEVARVTAREMATTGAHWTFSPVLCLSRDLRWGRTGETFGEDPFLIGELGAAMIRGYQGGGLDDADGVLACAKHYAGYSETQGGRDASDADLSRRKLRSSLVLLQNDGILPLQAAAVRKIAVIGPNADDDLAQLGDWSLGGSQHPSDKGKHPRECTVTLLDGIRARAPESCVVSHAPGCSLRSADESEIPAALAVCRDADVVVLVVGDDLPFIGEGHSTATLELPGAQRALLEAVVAP